jgi:pilus assembly protein Flp/PilA
VKVATEVANAETKTMTSLATLRSAARRFADFLADERGATAIEYAMIAAGIGAAIAATVYTLGSQVKGQYDKVSDNFQ